MNTDYVSEVLRKIPSNIRITCHDLYFSVTRGVWAGYIGLRHRSCRGDPKTWVKKSSGKTSFGSFRHAYKWEHRA
jgi:hypothetical protein